MVRKSRCVFGCDELGAYMHRFPHPLRRHEEFRLWTSIVGAEIQNLSATKVYMSKRVCDFHFKSEDKTSGHRLKILAVPTLHLQGVKAVSKYIEIEHNYSLPRMYSRLHERLPQHVAQDVQQPCTSSAMPETAAAVPQHIAQDIQEPCTSSTMLERTADLQRSQEYLLKELRRQKKESRKTKSQIIKLKKKVSNFKLRLADATKTAERKASGNMLPSAKAFFDMQSKQTHKNPKGRRFTLQQKTLCLSLYKRSPRIYPLLSKYFVLPSAKSLKNLLSSIKINTGINSLIFEKIKESIADLPLTDRLCSLMFDEMSITPQIQYQQNRDEIRGFADQNGENIKDLKFADHVLVFMIKGIKKNFKQPVAYYFTNSLKSCDLKKYIIEVINHVHSTGLRIICTVCDQGSANAAAINGLVEETRINYIKNQKEWRNDIFEVQGLPIIPIYDVPHLLKGLRNNLLSKDLIYTDSNEVEYRIKWSYFEELYKADKSYGELRCVQKLTEEHVVPEKIKKMRVKLASQVFSHSVAVAVEHLTARGTLPDQCRALIPFVLSIDKLFDSLNASTFHVNNGKIYRAAVRRSSVHHKLWPESIRLFKSIKFINNKGANCSAPSIKNFIKTILGIQSLWREINIRYGIDSLLTRNLNQDPLENFFGGIRSLGVRNTAPNFVGFEGAYKTLLINNLSSAHAINSNCEDDSNKCLQNLRFYLESEQNKENISTNPLPSSSNVQQVNFNLDNFLGENHDSNDGIGQRQYVCGYVVKKCLKRIKGCITCKKELLSNTPQEGCEFIKCKEYNKKKQWLIYPTKIASECFIAIQNTVTDYLKELDPRNVKYNIKLLCDILISFKFNCALHKNQLKEQFVNTSIDVVLYSWCRSVNRILDGKMTYDGNHTVKVSAQEYYNKHKVANKKK